MVRKWHDKSPENRIPYKKMFMPVVRIPYFVQHSLCSGFIFVFFGGRHFSLMISIFYRKKGELKAIRVGFRCVDEIEKN